MNRILFEHDEIVDGIATFGGERAVHVMTVLHGEIGQTLKTGEIDGKIGTGEIVGIENGDSDQVRISVKCRHDEESLKPWVDLILAPPRPRVMKRLLPQLASLGVGRLILIGARKVEKDFWGATLLKAENYRPLLLDGLMQSGTSTMPQLEVRRNLRKFMAEELGTMGGQRIVAHPSKNAVEPECVGTESVVLAIGPEGGWTDEEVELFGNHGFRQCSLGPRILRTDTATIALLARLMPK